MSTFKIALLSSLVALPLASVTLLSGCASTSHHESAGQFVDSSAITVKVKSALLADDTIKSLPITVNTYKNGVQLSGYVDSAYQKRRAGEIASHIEGVKVVRNALIIKPH